MSENFNNLMNNMFFRTIDYISRRRRIGRSRKCKSITTLSINLQSRYELVAAAAGEGENRRKMRFVNLLLKITQFSGHRLIQGPDRRQSEALRRHLPGRSGKGTKEDRLTFFCVILMFSSAPPLFVRCFP